MKIQLIHPPADKTYEGIEAAWLKSVPTGLALIASSIDDVCEVEIIDGNNMELPAILSMIDADVVGVSDWYSKHANALAIVEYAKNIGAKTVIGGPNATHLGERILKNNPFVDFVIAGDGEESFRKLVLGKHLKDIPNLIYKLDDKILKNKREDISLVKLFDLEHIVNPDYNPENPVPISSIRGCIKAEKDDRCSFCSIDHSLKLMSAEKVWEQVDLLNSKYGFDFFFETGDSFIVGKYPQMLLESRPDHLKNIKFRVYASPDQITEESAETFKALNVYEIFIGIESSDTDILRKAGKLYSKEDIDRALHLVNRAGIQRMQLPFIYGLPGETDESMEKTFQYAKSIVKAYPDVRILSSLPLPIFGSELFENIRKDSEARKLYKGDLDRDDFFDYEQLVRIQTAMQTLVDYDSVLNYVNKTSVLVGMDNAAGFGLV